MTNKKSTKRALLSSALALIMCISMLIGSTFAWFTDSVTSSGNIIQSGSLKVTMEWLNGKDDPTAEDAAWKDASTGAIFNSKLWEPGYTEVRHIKIENEGTLALKYKLNIVANGEVSDLADVIDVYYIDPATAAITDRTQLTEDKKIGTLTEVLAGLEESGNGVLVPAGKEGEGYKSVETITIALKMQESAGNEYQNKQIGSDFAIQLLATQYTYEEDSFDNQYDKDALYPVATATELQDALTEGKSVILANDIDATSVAFRSQTDAVDAVIDLDGNALTLTSSITVVYDNALTITGDGVVECAGVDVQKGAEVNFEDVDVVVTNDNVYSTPIQVRDGSVVNMNDGKIQGYSSLGGALVKVSGSGIFNMNGGEIIVTSESQQWGDRTIPPVAISLVSDSDSESPATANLNSGKVTLLYAGALVSPGSYEPCVLNISEGFSIDMPQGSEMAWGFESGYLYGLTINDARN